MLGTKISQGSLVPFKLTKYINEVSCFSCIFLGCTKGWHGRTDIIIMEKEVPVSVVESSANARTSSDVDTVSDISDAAVEVKLDKIPNSALRQMLAQTVVFSFLSFNRSNGLLKHSLVPSIGISKETLVVHMYDSVNDVLLASCQLDLFSPQGLHIRAVLLLWLVLNYKLFSTGVPDAFKQYSSNFHQKLGPDFLKIYQTEVHRPLHIRPTERDDYPKFNSIVFPRAELTESVLPHVASIEIDLSDAKSC